MKNTIFTFYGMFVSSYALMFLKTTGLIPRFSAGKKVRREQTTGFGEIFARRKQKL